MTASPMPQLGLLTSHAMTQLGLAVAGLGALVFVWGAAVMVVANRSYHGPSEAHHRNEKVAYLLGGILLMVGFALQFGALLLQR